MGVYICYDRHFPEGARILGLNGAEIVFNPSATVAGLSEYLWELEQPAHAAANGYFVAAINRVGNEEPWQIGEFYGKSYFCNPRGKIIAQASRDKDEVLVADIEFDEIARCAPPGSSTAIAARKPTAKSRARKQQLAPRTLPTEGKMDTLNDDHSQKTETRSEEIVRKHKEYIWPAVTNFYQQPLVADHASMQYVWDVEGNKYLDFFGGILTVSVGHCNPKVTSKIKAQVDKLQHTSTLYPNEAIVALAEKLAQITPGKLQKSFFTSSGTEANEAAILLARMATRVTTSSRCATPIPADRRSPRA